MTKSKTATLEAPAAPSMARRVEIEVADNGYVVRIYEQSPEYKTTQLVFTSQGTMLRTVKEATSMKTEEE